MSDFGVTVLLGELLLQLLDEAFLDFHHVVALAADEMVVVIRRVVTRQFETGDAVTEIEAFDKTFSLEKLHRTINRREITGIRERGMDLLAGHRMGMTTEHIDDRAALPGDAAFTVPQAIGQFIR